MGRGERSPIPTRRRLLYHRGAILVPYQWHGTTTIRGSGYFVLAREDGATLRILGGGAADVIAKGDALATMDVQVLGSQGPQISTIDWTFDPVYLLDIGEPFRPAFVGDRIVVTTGWELLGFDDRCPAAPEPLQGCWASWRIEADTTLTPPASVGTGQVAVGGHDGLVRVHDAAIVVGTYDGQVVAFPADGCGAATCAPLWEGSTVDGGRLLVTAATGMVAHGLPE